MILNRYKVVKQIGKHYKEVFVCIDTQDNHKQVVLKLERIGSSKESRLENEYNFYKRLSGSNCFAIVLDFFNDLNFRFMSMRPLGINLHKFYELERSCGQWSLEKVIKFADQMISRVANCHLRNIIHRDIKPENFVIDPEDNNKLYLIDFNLAKEYRDQQLVHIRYAKKSTKFSVGNVQFLSLNVHNGDEHSRRDDLLSLGYSIIFLANGSLPWTNIRLKDFNDRCDYLEAIKIEKNKCPIEDLCKGLPKEFYEFMNYCSKLDFYEEPKYIELRLLFTKCLEKVQKQNSKPSLLNESESIANTKFNSDSAVRRQKLSEMIKRIGQTSKMICV